MMNETTGDTCFTGDYRTLESFQNCVREQALSHIRYMSSSQVITFTFFYAIISLVGVLGNGLVIFVVIRRKEMRTNRNVFIVNLALSNFVLSLILVPFLWTPTYRIEFPYGAFMCKVAQAFPGANIFCSTLTVSAISVDRYYAVVRRKAGPGKMKTIQATLISAAIWMVSFLLSILYLLYFDTKDYSLPREYIPNRFLIQSNLDTGLLLFQRCELQPAPCLDPLTLIGSWNGSSEACYKFYETAVSSIMAAFIYFVPVPILVLFSVMLTRFLNKTERQHTSLRRAPTASSSKSAKTPGEASDTALLARAHSNPVLLRGLGKKTTHEPGTNNTKSMRNRRSSRTTSLLFAMAFSNALLWLPFTVISLFIQLAPTQLTQNIHDVLRQMDDAAKLISMLSICVNPFLYGYLNTNFKREFRSICTPFAPCVTGSHSRASSSKSAYNIGIGMARAISLLSRENERMDSGDTMKQENPRRYT